MVGSGWHLIIGCELSLSVFLSILIDSSKLWGGIVTVPRWLPNDNSVEAIAIEEDAAALLELSHMIFLRNWILFSTSHYAFDEDCTKFSMHNEFHA
jgi:hypothetical protein